jgi:hypothetical protein
VSGSVGNDVRARPWVGDCHWLCTRCQVLERLVRSPTIPQRVAERAKIALASADGEFGYAIAERLGVSRPTVSRA